MIKFEKILIVSIAILISFMFLPGVLNSQYSPQVDIVINDLLYESDIIHVEQAVLNEIHPVKLENNDNKWKIEGINFESINTDESWTYVEGNESTRLTFDEMRWSNDENIISHTKSVKAEVYNSSLIYSDVLGEGINIKIIQDNYQWQKIVEIESLASLGNIPKNIKYLDISFKISSDLELPEGIINNPIQIGENSFIQPIKAWDSLGYDNSGAVGFITEDLIITKRIPVEWLRSASYPVQTDITITYGSESVFNIADTSYISVAALDSTHFVIAYRDVGNSNYGTAVVGVVSGTTITYGSESVFNIADTSYISVAALDSTHFVIAYRDVGNSNYGTAVVGVVSGTTITSYGSENVFSTGIVECLSVATFNSTHFVVGFENATVSDCAAIVGVVSGTTITSYGSENVFSTDHTESLSVATLNNTHFVVVYEGNAGYGIVGNVSGSTITLGSENEFHGVGVVFFSVAALDTTHFVVSYVDVFGGNSYAIVGVVSGNTISSYGSESVFNSNILYYNSITALDSSHFILAYALENDDGNAMSGTVSGTTISSYGTENTFNAAITHHISVTSLDTTHFVVTYRDVGNSNYGTGIVGLAESPPASYIPPDPNTLTNTTGDFWVNHTYAAGSGNITDSYNISVNGTWYNETTALFFNDTYCAHAWQNITVYAYNSTGVGTLSNGSVSQNTQIPNNLISILNISASYSLNEGEIFTLDANYTDLDFDIAVFLDNSSNWTINSATGEVSWLTTSSDVGNHYYRITVDDVYGSTDYQDFTVTVSEIVEILSTDPTGDFDLDTNNAQELSVELNFIATSVWYVDEIEIQTDHNTTTPSYYFTVAMTGIYNVTCISTDPINGSTESFTWFITVIDEDAETPAVSAPRPSYRYEEVTDYLSEVWIDAGGEGIDTSVEEVFEDVEEIFTEDVSDQNMIWIILICASLLFYACYKD